MVRITHNVYSRLGFELGAVMVVTRVAVANYGQWTCFGRSINGPVGDTYLLLSLGIGVSGAIFGAVGAHQGAKALGIAAIVTNILAFMWPI